MVALALEESVGYEEFRIELFYDPKLEAFNLLARSLAGETMLTDFHCPFSLAELDEALAGITRSNVQFIRSTQRSTVDTVRTLGTRLFASISENRIGEMYQQSSVIAKERGRNLRLRFVLNHVWMAAMPWEFLFDTTRLDFLTLSTRSPVVRQWHLPSPPVSVPTSIEPPLRVLVAIAEVNEWDKGSAAAELEVLKQFEKSPMPIEIELVHDATPLKLLSALQQKSCHFLHLIASGAQLGTGDGSPWGAHPGRAYKEPTQHSLLLLPDETATSRPTSQAIDMSILLNTISRTQKELRLVYFSGDVTDWLACQTTAVSPATLGWRGRNTVEAYLSFTRGFYAAMVLGQPIEAAVTHGRKAIDSEYPGGREWGMPVFYLQNENSAALRQEKQILESIATSKPKPRGSRVLKGQADRELEKLQVQLTSAEENHSSLLKEMSKFSGQSVPDYLAVQLAGVNQKIADLKLQIEQHSK